MLLSTAVHSAIKVWDSRHMEEKRISHTNPSDLSSLCADDLSSSSEMAGYHKNSRSFFFFLLGAAPVWPLRHQPIHPPVYILYQCTSKYPLYILYLCFASKLQLFWLQQTHIATLSPPSHSSPRVLSVPNITLYFVPHCMLHQIPLAPRLQHFSLQQTHIVATKPTNPFTIYRCSRCSSHFVPNITSLYLSCQIVICTKLCVASKLQIFGIIFTPHTILRPNRNLMLAPSTPFIQRTVSMSIVVSSSFVKSEARAGPEKKNSVHQICAESRQFF